MQLPKATGPKPLFAQSASITQCIVSGQGNFLAPVLECWDLCLLVILSLKNREMSNLTVVVLFVLIVAFFVPRLFSFASVAMCSAMVMLWLLLLPGLLSLNCCFASGSYRLCAAVCLGIVKAPHASITTRMTMAMTVATHVSWWRWC